MCVLFFVVCCREFACVVVFLGGCFVVGLCCLLCFVLLFRCFGMLVVRCCCGIDALCVLILVRVL